MFRSVAAMVEKTVGLLKDLVENVGDESTATKTMLCRSIQPHLAIASFLLPHAVMESSSAAESLLGFFLQTFRVSKIGSITLLSFFLHYRAEDLLVRK